MIANNKEYESKSGDYFAFARTEVLPLLPASFCRIADIGGSSGATLSAIKSRFSHCETVCIDGHPPSVEIARSRGHLSYHCNLESGLPEVLKECDVVLLLDVLEHLRDPWSVLAEITKMLRANATVIVSLPNVRYWEVSCGLFFRGAWHLQDAGVLDRTHLRFFTRSTGRDMIEQAGLAHQKTVGKLGGGRKYRLIDGVTANVFGDFLNMQYLYVATKPK